MQSLLLRYSFVTGPAIDQSQDLVIMTRSQLLENGMLLQRVGHLSSFHPSAGDLTSYLVLNIMREVVCGPSIKHLLDLNVEDATDDINNSGVQATKNKKPRPNNVSTSKQKNALKALEGFLSTDTAGDAASRLRTSSSINDKDAVVDDDDSQQDDQIKSNGKKGRKKKGEAKSQNKGQAKVKDFTAAKIHTPAVEKKIVHRGGGGKKEDKPKSAKKTIEAVNPQPPTTTAADLVAIAETKKMLEEIRKATQEQKRANEEILRNSKALQQQREGKILVLSF